MKKTNVVSEFAKEFGAEVIWDLSEDKTNVAHTPTDVLSINWLFGGVGGIPHGRLIELSGKESSGKTTLCYKFVESAQKSGFAAYIDTEASIVLDYAYACGVDRDKLVLCKPDYGEQAFELIEKFIQDKRFSIVVLDSIAALAPRAESEGDVGDQYMGLVARMNSQAMRRISPLLKRTSAIVVFVNQARANLTGYGSPEQTSGGFALKHALQVRIHVKKKEKLVLKGKEFGFISELKVLKNKVALPGRTVNVPILYGKGIDARYALIDAAVKSGAIAKTTVYKIKGKTISRSWQEAYAVISKNAKANSFVIQKIDEYLNKTSQTTSE